MYMGTEELSNSCKHCGSTEGYYVKVQIQGSAIFRYNFDNSEYDENGDLHDHLSYKHGKIAYCIDCNKRLFKTSDL
jgi:hypothetical protein